MVTIGVDETALGAIAGDFIVAATAYPEGVRPPSCSPNGKGRRIEIKDSKRVQEAHLDPLCALIRATAIAYEIITVSPQQLDKMGGGHNAKLQTIATITKRIAERLHIYNVATAERRARIIIDGFIDLGDLLQLPYEGVPRADVDQWPVSAASILAKKTQIDAMIALHRKYPVYAFNKHRGYPTPEHLERLRKHGPCPAHRFTTRTLIPWRTKPKPRGRE